MRLLFLDLLLSPQLSCFFSHTHSLSFFLFFSKTLVRHTAPNSPMNNTRKPNHGSLERLIKKKTRILLVRIIGFRFVIASRMVKRSAVSPSMQAQGLPTYHDRGSMTMYYIRLRFPSLHNRSIQLSQHGPPGRTSIVPCVLFYHPVLRPRGLGPLSSLFVRQTLPFRSVNRS